MNLLTTLTAIGLELEFPAGIHPGAGKDLGNQLIISMDGCDRPVLRGSALAGILRHAYAEQQKLYPDDPQVEAIFGRALNDREPHSQDEQPSCLKVENLVLQCTQGQSFSSVRTHNAINRHRGAVKEHGLYSLQQLPPGVSGSTVLWLQGRDERTARQLAETLALILKQGLTMGGHSARGIGLCQLHKLRFKTYQCSDPTQHAQALDAIYTWRKEGKLPEGETLSHGGQTANQLHCEFCLSVAPGQDFLISDSNEMTPQRITIANGKEHWLLPGSTLRGLFRDWCNRLAAREGLTIADSKDQCEASGDMAGWCFDSQDQRESKKKALSHKGSDIKANVPCPVSRLFGSLYSGGRIHISDAVSSKPIQNSVDTQARKHVAIDMITGGANEGMLFDNTVIVSREQHFHIHLVVDQPEEREAQWLAKCIRALDMGLIRVGSSKASGALSLVGPVQSRGPQAELFHALKPSRQN